MKINRVSMPFSNGALLAVRIKPVFGTTVSDKSGSVVKIYSRPSTNSFRTTILRRAFWKFPLVSAGSAVTSVNRPCTRLPAGASVCWPTIKGSKRTAAKVCPAALPSAWIACSIWIDSFVPAGTASIGLFHAASIDKNVWPSGSDSANSTETVWSNHAKPTKDSIAAIPTALLILDAFISSKPFSISSKQSLQSTAFIADQYPLLASPSMPHSNWFRMSFLQPAMPSRLASGCNPQRLYR